MKASDILHAVEEQEKMRHARLGMERDALRDIVCEDGFATIVTGVRRCGKSTLLNQWAEKSRARVVSINFDDLRMSTFETSDFAVLDSVVREMGVDTLLLDEVQDVPEWERFVTGCLDEGRRVLVTGSNAKMLSRELGTKLTGRHLNAELYPFSYFCASRKPPRRLRRWRSTSA